LLVCPHDRFSYRLPGYYSGRAIMVGTTETLLIRQLYDGREVGRMTWRLTAATEPEPQDDQDVDLETRSFPEKHPLLGTGSTRRLP
jgi:hypothetical protein